MGQEKAIMWTQPEKQQKRKKLHTAFRNAPRRGVARGGVGSHMSHARCGGGRGAQRGEH